MPLGSQHRPAPSQSSRRRWSIPARPYSKTISPPPHASHVPAAVIAPGTPAAERSHADRERSGVGHVGLRKEGVVLVPGKRFAVFSIREKGNGSIWTRAGTAFVNKDGS